MTVRFVQVGTGVRGAQWAQVIREERRAQNAAYVGLDAAQTQKQVAGWGEDAPCFDDLEGALEMIRPDAVLLVTPPEGHHQQALTAFRHGCHVLCEKPLSESISEAVDMARQAEGRGLHLMAGMNFRYLSASQMIRKMITGGDLGEAGYGHFTYLRNRDGRRPDLNKYPLSMPQPMLLEQSVHHLDLMRYCYDDEVMAVSADTWRPAWSTYADDCCVSALLQFRKGMRVNYIGAWTSGWNRFCFEWRTDCSGGVLVQRSQFDDLFYARLTPGLALEGELFKTSPDVEPLQPLTLEPCRAFMDDTRGLLAEFLAAVEEEKPLLTSGKDHLKTLALVFACIEASKSGRRIEMQDFYRAQGIPEGWV